MTEEKHYLEKLSFGEIRLDVYPVGNGIAAVLSGGDAPHIGCTVLCEPRESLSGDGSISCTSSVLNRAGHKDERICRLAAEELCRKYQTVVCCTGGFHRDHISPEETEEVITATERLLSKV